MLLRQTGSGKTFTMTGPGTASEEAFCGSVWLCHESMMPLRDDTGVEVFRARGLMQQFLQS